MSAISAQGQKLAQISCLRYLKAEDVLNVLRENFMLKWEMAKRGVFKQREGIFTGLFSSTGRERWCLDQVPMQTRKESVIC